MWGYDLLYHSFAWIYDFAAWLVSAGRWNAWIRETERFIKPGPVLDLGCGKGILLQQLSHQNITSVGLDESPQMLRYSRQILKTKSVRLVRGVGQNLPFCRASFGTITATFPALYIFESATLQEIHRALQPDGSLIILLTAVVTGTSLHERLIRFLTRPFGFATIPQTQQDKIIKLLRANGLEAEIRWVEVKHSRLLFIFAQPV